LVGVVYDKPDPDSQPFVTVGQQVKKGQTICLVEAMKMFNEVKSPCDGHIQSVLFEDGQLVEFDQPLFEIGD
jgi:acetyl-CoA carboxylase biotin carboxyl carrier protein